MPACAGMTILEQLERLERLERSEAIERFHAPVSHGKILPRGFAMNRRVIIEEKRSTED
jgi:hypothetical protein